LRRRVEAFEVSLFTDKKNRELTRREFEKQFSLGSAASVNASAPPLLPAGVPDEDTAKNSHGYRDGKHYVAVHLRAFGPSCKIRVSRALQRGKQTVQWVNADADGGRRAVVAEDICGMTDAYVDAALASSRVPPDWPVVLAHDGRDPERAAALAERYGAVSYQGPMGSFVDLLLMVRAGFFIGNPASSFSTNAARVRHASLSDPATTLRCGGPQGQDPAQC